MIMLARKGVENDKFKKIQLQGATQNQQNREKIIRENAQGADFVRTSTGSELEPAESGRHHEKKAAKSFENGKKLGHVHQYLANVH